MIERISIALAISTRNARLPISLCTSSKESRHEIGDCCTQPYLVISVNGKQTISGSLGGRKLCQYDMKYGYDLGNGFAWSSVTDINKETN